MKHSFITLLVTGFLLVVVSGCSNNVAKSSDFDSSSNHGGHSSSASSNSSDSSSESSSGSSGPSSSHEHTYSASWACDAEFHWHESACGHDVISGKAAHSFAKEIVAPTYESEGYTVYTCSVCGYSYKDNYVDKLIRTYAITWKNYDGTVLETDDSVKEGDTPVYDGPAPTKPDDGTYEYSFSGWEPAVAPAHSDQTYVAKFSSERISYAIDFDLNGGSSASYSGPKTVYSFSKDIFFFDCVKEGYNFRGWSYNGTKVLDEKGSLLSNPSMSKSMVFAAVYADTAKMGIAVNMPEAGSVSGDGEYSYNTYVDVSARPYQGYRFVGWYYNGTLLSNTEDY